MVIFVFFNSNNFCNNNISIFNQRIFRNNTLIVNFIIISFYFLIEDNTTLQYIIPGMWIFTIAFIVTYIPISILINSFSVSFKALTLFFNSVLVSKMMKIEDTNMPINRLIRITTILGISGAIFLIYGLLATSSELSGFYRFLGSLQMFVSVNFWIYRLLLRKLANNFQLKILPIIDNYYEKILKKILIGKRPYFIILSTFILLILSFITFEKSVESQRTSIEFFPNEDPRQIIVYVQYPEGTDISKTN